MQDERIIAEMHKIGEQYPNRTAVGQYQINGMPECIVGELCDRLGAPVSKDCYLLAGMLFSLLGASVRMQAALTAAQKVNDYRLPWKYAVRAFDLVIEQFVDESAGDPSVCPCGCAAWKGGVVLDAVQRVLLEASGVLYVPKIIPPQTVVTPTAVGGNPNLASGFKKKDHALTA